MNATYDPHDLVGAYVLESLDNEEASEYEAHLGSCATCRDEVAELRCVTDILALAVDEVEPPAVLRERILAELTQDSAERPRFSLVEGRAPRRDGPKRLGRMQTLLSAAAVLAIVALGGWNIALQANRGTSHSTALADQLAAAVASGARVTHIPGTSAYPAANAALVQPRVGSAYLVVDGLSPAPSQKLYQLWLVKPRAAPRSAGVFSVSTSQPLVYRLPVAATGYPVAAVTVEPMPGGSKGPTGAKVLAGSISA